MKIVILILCFLGATSGVANEKEASSMKGAPVSQASSSPSSVKDSLSVIDKGVEISLEHYDLESDTFEIMIVDQPDVGPNVATPEAVYKALGLSVEFETFKAKKDTYIGKDFHLKDRLSLIDEDEVSKRQNKNKK